jgi:hypothetical protein
MKLKLLIALLFITAFLVTTVWSPSHARTWEHRDLVAWKTLLPDHGITCGTVRAAVALWGLSQARQYALDHGMTPSQENRARRCLGPE